MRLDHIEAIRARISRILGNALDSHRAVDGDNRHRLIDSDRLQGVVVGCVPFDSYGLGTIAGERQVRLALSLAGFTAATRLAYNLNGKSTSTRARKVTCNAIAC